MFTTGLMQRREFITTTASLCAIKPAFCETMKQRGGRMASRLRITSIEPHTICIPYHPVNHDYLFKYHGIRLQLRTIYILKTNQPGLEGYGDAWGPAMDESNLEKYIGTNPFEWLTDTKLIGINMAIYDLVGKCLDLPVWKLIGAKVRNKVPVSAWTCSRPPRMMAEEVTHAAKQGYTWLKYHVDEVQDVIAQAEAMDRVAPAGFKVHYDFNANQDFETVAPVVKELERFTVSGRIEDPIVADDPDGWVKIRNMTDLPILGHHAPTSFVAGGQVDGMMSGHAPVRQAAKLDAIAEQAGIPIMLQNAGGTINQSFLVHQACVFNTATIDHVNLARMWVDDISNEQMPITNAYVELSKGPGLGMTLNRDKLAKYEHAPRRTYEPFIVVIKYADGPTIYVRHNPDLPNSTDNMRFLGRLIKGEIPGPKPAYDNDVKAEFWQEPSSSEWQQMWNRTVSGHVVKAGI